MPKPKTNLRCYSSSCEYHVLSLPGAISCWFFSCWSEHVACFCLLFYLAPVSSGLSTSNTVFLRPTLSDGLMYFSSFLWHIFLCLQHWVPSPCALALYIYIYIYIYIHIYTHTHTHTHTPTALFCPQVPLICLHVEISWVWSVNFENHTGYLEFYVKKVSGLKKQEISKESLRHGLFANHMNSVEAS